MGETDRDKFYDALCEFNSGAYQFIPAYNLQDILDKLEDAVVNTKRRIRDNEKY